MRIGFISTRFSGTDGVSLESNKLAEILEEMGHEVYFCAGELDKEAKISHKVPLMSLNHSTISSIQAEAFQSHGNHRDDERIRSIGKKLKKEIANFVTDYKIDILFSQNAQSIPMNLPLGVALGDFIEENSFPAIAHHHDFWWERERFLESSVNDILEEYFPPKADSIAHLVINSLARDSLENRKRIEATLLPNVFKFTPDLKYGIDDFNKDLRDELGLLPEETFFLQPTRVVPRKGIEHSIVLISKLDDFSNKLFITHEAGDEGTEYLNYLRTKADARGVDLKYVPDKCKPERTTDPEKCYSLWDAYTHADFVTYPSIKEGFGNALLETVYFKVPALINRYPVYISDIAPLGFQFVEMEGEITSGTVEKTRKVLEDPGLRSEMVENNYRLGEKYFSYHRAEEILTEVLESF